MSKPQIAEIHLRFEGKLYQYHLNSGLWYSFVIGGWDVIDDSRVPEQVKRLDAKIRAVN